MFWLPQKTAGDGTDFPADLNSSYLSGSHVKVKIFVICSHTDEIISYEVNTDHENIIFLLALFLTYDLYLVFSLIYCSLRQILAH